MLLWLNVVNNEVEAVKRSWIFRRFKRSLLKRGFRGSVSNSNSART